jgi:hypothetical protein
MRVKTSAMVAEKLKPLYGLPMNGGKLSLTSRYKNLLYSHFKLSLHSALLENSSVSTIAMNMKSSPVYIPALS